MTDLKNTKCIHQKIPFDTRREASEYIKVTNATRKYRSKSLRGCKNNRKLRPYLCPFCGKYHLTTRKMSKGYDKARKR